MLRYREATVFTLCSSELMLDKLPVEPLLALVMADKLLEFPFCLVSSKPFPKPNGGMFSSLEVVKPLSIPLVVPLEVTLELKWP